MLLRTKEMWLVPGCCSHRIPGLQLQLRMFGGRNQYSCWSRTAWAKNRYLDPSSQSGHRSERAVETCCIPGTGSIQKQRSETDIHAVRIIVASTYSPNMTMKTSKTREKKRTSYTILIEKQGVRATYPFAQTLPKFLAYLFQRQDEGSKLLIDNFEKTHDSKPQKPDNDGHHEWPGREWSLPVRYRGLYRAETC